MSQVRINRTTTDLDRGCAAQAMALREFGYPDVTSARVREAHARWVKNESPIDIVDRFCFTEFDDRPLIFGVTDMQG